MLGGGIYVNNLVGKQFKNLNKSQVSLMELLDIYDIDIDIDIYDTKNQHVHIYKGFRVSHR